MNSKQVSFLTAMLEESTIAKASERAGISRKTAYKYLQNEDFKKELEIRRAEFISDTARYLQSKLILCSETLVEIVKKETVSDQIKINAINAIYSNCKALTETAEIIERLNRIEENIKDGVLEQGK